jgi:hypothetical protein
MTVYWKNKYAAVSSIYIWSENSSPKSEASIVLTAQTRTINRDCNWRPIAPSIFAILIEWAEISYFEFNLRSSFMPLWTDNLISDAFRWEKNKFSWEIGIKAVYDLQSYWKSMPAILASLFSWAEWLKFLLSIYMELKLRLSKGFYVGDIKGKGFLTGVAKGDAENVRTRTCLIILMCAGMRDS